MRVRSHVQFMLHEKMAPVMMAAVSLASLQFFFRFISVFVNISVCAFNFVCNMRAYHTNSAIPYSREELLDQKLC